MTSSVQEGWWLPLAGQGARLGKVRGRAVTNQAAGFLVVFVFKENLLFSVDTLIVMSRVYNHR